jgi:hypothetical protein
MTNTWPPQPGGTNYPPPQPPGAPGPIPGGKAASTSFALGVAGVLTMIICLGAALGPAALVAGFISRNQARRHGAPTPRKAKIGIALGVLCVILTVAGLQWIKFVNAHPDPFECWPVKHHTGCY